MSPEQPTIAGDDIDQMLKKLYIQSIPAKKKEAAAMSYEQRSIAGDIQQTLDEQDIQPTTIMEKKAAAPSPISIPEDQPVIKTYVDIVSEMSKETKLGKITDVVSMIELACGHLDAQAAEGENEPEWYHPYAMFYAAFPCRQARGEFTKQLFEEHKEWIRDDWKGGQLKVLDYACGTGLASQALAPHVASIFGVDRASNMVAMYNEIVKRQRHPTCAMEAHVGDLMPPQYTGVAPGFVAERPVRDYLATFDMVLVSLGVDSFETLDLPAKDRHHQLCQSLHALVQFLGDNGTLLILDIQRDRDQHGRNGYGLVDGHKTAGYHSGDIVDALESMGMDEIDVLDGKRFTWEATEEEKKIWLPAEADEVFFMVKAKKGDGFKRLMEDMMLQMAMMDMLGVVPECTCGHEH
ncbi:MAG: hypothetical protein Q9208_007633 [Pyrenodesmia sp. 3 TL-2023]